MPATGVRGAGWRGGFVGGEEGTARAMTNQYASLTFPRFRPLLAVDRDDIAVITVESDQPEGLALLQWPQFSMRTARLLSIMVDPRHRRAGVGRTLLARAESAARARGCISLVAFYSSRLPCRERFEHLLAGAGWKAPEVQELRIACFAAVLAAEMDRLEATHRPFLPEGATIGLWSSVTVSERLEVDRVASAIEFSRDLDPGLFEKKAHPDLSLVLRHNGKIAGWVFGEALSDDLCFYGCGYVIPELRRRCAMVALIREEGRRQAAMFGPESVVQWATTPQTPGMPRFMHERVGPCSLWYDHFFRVSKDLAVGPSDPVQVRVPIVDATPIRSSPA